MSEATAIVALVLLALGLLSALIVLWRRPAAPVANRREFVRDDFPATDQWAECPRETVAHIFGPEDLTFVRGKASVRLRRAFERDRREIALRWVWSAFDETQQIISRHFRLVRS